MTEKNKNFLDNMFDGVEAIVGGLEKSKELADPLPPDDEDEINEKRVIDVKSPRQKLIWGVDREVSAHHIFVDFTTTALCGRFFDAHQLTNRKTELDDGNFKCCGGCLRILQARYEHG